MVIDADDPRYLPDPVFVLPDVDELGFAGGLVIAGMAEPVYADLDRAEVRQRIHFERSRNQDSRHFAADVVLDRFDGGRTRPAQPGYVVVELQVVCQQRAEFLQIAVIIGVEQLSVQLRCRLSRSATTSMVNAPCTSTDVSKWRQLTIARRPDGSVAACKCSGTCNGFDCSIR